MFGTNINNKGKIEKNSKVKEGECIFPFKYKYKEHNKCFPTEKGDICATTVNKNNTLQTYGYCKKNRCNLRFIFIKLFKKKLNIF